MAEEQPEEFTEICAVDETQCNGKCRDNHSNVKSCPAYCVRKTNQQEDKE